MFVITPGPYYMTYHQRVVLGQVSHYNIHRITLIHDFETAGAAALAGACQHREPIKG